MKNSSSLFYFGAGIAFLFVLIYVLEIDHISFPWIDEIGTTDTAANVVMYGKWESHVWTYTYNPLHAFLLIGWLSVFGISHLTVCSLSVILAYIAYLILLRILINRCILLNPVNTIIYSFLFWGGYTFSTLLTQGRIDMLALIFTILLTNEIIPIGTRFYSDNKWAIRLYAFLFMATAIYPVPLFLFLCMTIFYTYNKNAYIRSNLVIRYRVIFVSFVLSFSLICLFYLYHHSMFRFLHTYLFSNATISANQKTFVERIYEAYCLEVQALIICFISFFIIFFNKRYNRINVILSLFVLLIPLLMVIAGRYTIYYSWLFYIPVLVLLIYSISLISSSRIRVIILVLSSLPLFIKSAVTYNERAQTYQLLNKAEAFVNKNAKVLSSGENVLFFNSLFYYSLIENHAAPWVHYGGLKDKPSPTEKFSKLCEKYIENPVTRERLFSALIKIEDTDTYLPQKGYVLIWGEEEMENVTNYFNTNKYGYKLYSQSDSISLLYFQSY